jgi:hypothetical protein
MRTGINLFFILFVSTICVAFTSCRDDDDTDPAKAIEATYKGTLNPNQSEVPIASGVEIKIEYVSKNKAKLNLTTPVSGITGIACETQVTVDAKESNKYLLEGTASPDLKIGETTTIQQVPINVTGSVKIVANVKTATINITVGSETLQTEVSIFPLEVVFNGVNL